MKTLTVPALARVEGEGGLLIEVKDGAVADIKLNIYEPPRFFEGFLRGRHMQEVPDITARICGICPVAYQMSSVLALEQAQGVEVSAAVRELRRLFYCAEWIESHALHIYMLQGPDLLGHESALSLAAEAPEVVKTGLRLKKIGNELLRVIAGRSVHPVNACVGGFYSWPAPEALNGLLPELEWGLEAARETARWAARLKYPELDVDYEFVALHRPDEYAVLDGQVLSSHAGALPVEAFETRYLERHVRHSNALHCLTADGRPYLVGPLARLNLNFAQLHPAARQTFEEIGLELPLRNPYKMLLARAVELVHAYALAIDLVRAYAPSGPSALAISPRAGEGRAATEAPRGLLYHRYSTDAHGLIERARIVPPTAQNLARIEADLWQLAPNVLRLPQAEASLECEHLIRAYDPCISCATHFLKLDIRRT